MSLRRCLLLKGEGYATEAAKSPAAVIKAVEADYALVLMDLNYAHDDQRPGRISCCKAASSTPRCPW